MPAAAVLYGRLCLNKEGESKLNLLRWLIFDPLPFSALAGGGRGEGLLPILPKKSL
jgi:hypothetical protein